MPSLFSAGYKAQKYNIDRAFINLKQAVRSNQEQEALKYYADLKRAFNSLLNMLSIASFFEKRKVKSFQKKIMGKADALLTEKGWAEDASTVVEQ